MSVRQLGPDEVTAAGEVLSEAFRSYPMGRYVLGASPDFPDRLRSFLTFFVRGTMIRDEWVFGVGDPGSLRAVAVVSRSHTELPEELTVLREALWTELGGGARERYLECGRAMASLSMDEPHLQLILIGVPPAHQGRGLARQLLDAVHELSASDETSRGVVVSTEAESNLPIYEHFGYEMVGRATHTPELHTWMLFRPDER